MISKNIPVIIQFIRLRQKTMVSWEKLTPICLMENI